MVTQVKTAASYAVHLCSVIKLWCHVQAFPLTVKLHLIHLSLHITFAYLPSLGLVTAEAGDPAGNELLATLFDTDIGVHTPKEAHKYMGEDDFEFDTAATARPYR